MTWPVVCLHEMHIQVDILTYSLFVSAAMERPMQTDEVLTQRSLFKTGVLACGVR